MIDPRDVALPASKLRWTCRPEELEFESLEEVADVPGIIGQDRAVDAIRLGVAIRSKGHNIFVAGPSGSGRATTVRHLLETTDTGRGAPDDIVYVHNFQQPDYPIALHLPAGQGRAFAMEMAEFVGTLRRNIAQIYESEDYKRRMKETYEHYAGLEKEAVRSLETKVKADNFALVEIKMGPFSKPEVVPLIAGEPRSLDQLDELAAQGKFPVQEIERLRALYGELREHLESTFRRSRELKRQLKDALSGLEQEFGRPVVEDALGDIRARFSGERIASYLDQVREQSLASLSRFLDKEPEEGDETPRKGTTDDPRYRPFLVNVLVDNTGVTRPPVVVETSPNHRNLFGTIEKVVDRSGHWMSDFLHIKAGSLLRANGGFLIVDLHDAGAEPGVWHALKRSLRNQAIDIQSYDPMYLFSTSALKPEPIRLDVRVIVLGDAYSYQVLYNFDPDFRKIFKVKADFDTVMARDREGVMRYAGFIKSVCRSEGLHLPDREGVAAVVEHGARLAGQSGKLSTRFSELADLLREANYWTDLAGKLDVGRSEIERALEERDRRLRLPEEKLQEMIEDGSIRIETEGAVVGQVNGLSVFDLGDHRFGRPSRITAQVSLGQGGLLSIEREAELSGRSFNKAMLIIDGFFRARFGQEFPLSMNASIAFEQSYGEVDGDSASVAEILALMSSAAELPVRQDLAVTGSADQLGNVQPIGGANEKIEGFFEVCLARGLTGTQGVVIPAQNARELMLAPRVVSAVETGRFHVYAVSTVEEAMELALSTPAGKRGDDGLYEENSIYGRVQDRLHFYAERMREYGKPPDGPAGDVQAADGPHAPHQGGGPNEPPSESRPVPSPRRKTRVRGAPNADISRE